MPILKIPKPLQDRSCTVQQREPHATAKVDGATITVTGGLVLGGHKNTLL